MDEWWNRNFPPYSLRRLGFLLAWVPLFSALTLWLGATFIRARFSWLLVLYMSLATALIMVMGWMVSIRQSEARRGGPPEEAARHARPPQTTTVPGPIQKAVPGRIAADWSIDLVVSAGIFFVGLTIALLVMGQGASPEQLGINLIVALAFGFTLSSRFSLASLIALSLLIGLGGAIILQLFFLILSGGNDFPLYWAVSSLVVFAFAYPMWQQMQRSRDRWEKIPAWAIATGTACLLMLTAAISEVL